MVHTLTQMTKSKNSVSETRGKVQSGIRCWIAAGTQDAIEREAHPVSAKAWARTT